MAFKRRPLAFSRFQPEDLGQAVKLANAFVAASDRRVDWIHIPVLDRSDDAFFAPLKELKPKGRESISVRFTTWRASRSGSPWPASICLSFVSGPIAASDGSPRRRLRTSLPAPWRPWRAPDDSREMA